MKEYSVATSFKRSKSSGNWKENVVSKKNQEILKSALIKVINDPDGAGRIAQVDGVTLAGKTGTAELKESKEADGKELGWFALSMQMRQT